MMDFDQQRSVPMIECLKKQAESVEPAGHQRWRFELNGGARVRGVAWQEKDWWFFRASLGRGGRLAARRLERMLCDNGDLGGGAKFGLGEGRSQVMLSAEIPWEADEDADPAGWIGEVCSGFRQAARRFADGKAPAAAPPETDETADPQSATKQAAEFDLADLCVQADWPFTRRASGQIAVELEVRDGFHQAFHSRDGGRHRLWVELGHFGSDHRACRKAVHVLLLWASGVVRMARAAAAAADAGLEYRWEVLLGEAPNAWQLRHALSALSVACRLTAREVQVLEDESIAREFLSVRGIA